MKRVDERDFFRRGPSLEVFGQYLALLKRQDRLCWPWDCFHMLCIYYPKDKDPTPLLQCYIEAAGFNPVNEISARTGLRPLAEVVRMDNTRMLHALVALGADIQMPVDSLFGISESDAEAFPHPPWSLLDYSLMFPTSSRLLVLTIAELTARASKFPLNSVDWVEQFLRDRARLLRVQPILLCRRIQKASPLLDLIGKYMVAQVVRLAWEMRFCC